MESVRYGKRQGTLKNNSEWRTARRIEVRYLMFAVPFSIRCAVSYVFVPMFSIQGSLFKVRHSPRHSPRRSPFASSCAAPFAAISYSFSTIFAIQTSLFNVRHAVSHSQFSICQSPSHSPFATPFAVAFQCPLTLSYGKHQGTLKNNSE